MREEGAKRHSLPAAVQWKVFQETGRRDEGPQPADPRVVRAAEGAVARHGAVFEVAAVKWGVLTNCRVGCGSCNESRGMQV